MPELLDSYIGRWMAVVIAIACGTALELMFGERHGLVSRLRGILFWSLYIVGFVVSTALLRAAVDTFGLRPLISIDLRPFGQSVAGLIAIALIPALISDLIYYGFHRLQHGVPFLWRFHQVHHSYEELNVANCAHHPLEDLLQLPFLVVPLVLIVELKSTHEATVLAFIFATWSALNHTSVRVARWPLKYLIAWPDYHRIHHSIAPEHRDKNFAVIFPIWDMLFRTACFPKPNERITTGVADRHEPRTLSQYLFGLRQRDQT